MNMDGQNDQGEVLSDEELLRYSRQIMLPKFDVSGQESLKKSIVTIVGLGGLGSPVALYLAAAGVGSLIFVDDDVVDLSNLQRQIAHTESSQNESKVDSAKKTAQRLNSATQIATYNQRIDESLAEELIAKSDVVVDCSDNFDTRFLLNRVCFAHKTPLVSGAAIRMEGQIAVYDFRHPDSPCYQCLYPNRGNEDLNCSQAGVMAPLVGIIGSMQAMETVKLIAGVGETLTGKLLVLDAMNMQWRTLRLRPDVNCPICGAG